MLSKSAARMFFVVGTVVTTGVFVGLTIDTFNKIPAQTRGEAITPEVVRGKELWEQNNCMGCHTLFGEGGYYAPDLSQVYARRGPMFIRAMLTDPEAMYPGQRRMVKYDFTLTEQDDLIAFFEWAGQVDLNGFPAPPTIGVAGAGGPAAAALASPEVFQQVCSACHSVGGWGGKIGPALDGVADRYDEDYLRRWLEDPLAVKADSRMPKLKLTPEQLDELVAYLSTLEAAEVGR
jgi:nitric oxide reductase subunit C